MILSDPFAVRRAGILLHPTSLPGAAKHGALGADAFRFVDILASAGQTVWQLLPLGPTHENQSPYQCLSLYAGNPALVSTDSLLKQGWLEAGDGDLPAQALLALACDRFLDHADDKQRHDWHQFCRAQHDWLDDYALFQVLREQHHHADWTQWPAALRDRQPTALENVRRECSRAYDRIRVQQYFFVHQWQALKRYADICRPRQR